MSLEAIRIIAEHLADATYGVNAVLDIVPRDSGDDAPADVTVLNETAVGWVARNQIPREKGSSTAPQLTVEQWQAAEYPAIPKKMQGGALVWETSPVLLLKYITRGTLTEDVTRDALYTERAIRGSLMLFNDNAHRKSRESRNGVDVLAIRSITRHPPASSEKDNVVVLALLVTLDVIETVPVASDVSLPAERIEFRTPTGVGLYVGDRARNEVWALDDEGRRTDTWILLRSSDEDVCVVTPRGWLAGISAGEATITAETVEWDRSRVTVGRLTETYRVLVAPAPAVRLTAGADDILASVLTGTGLNEAFADAIAEGKAVFMEGEYDGDVPLVVPGNGLTVKGAARETTQFIMRGATLAATPTPVLTISGRSNVTFQEVGFTYDAAPSTLNAYGTEATVNITGSTDCLLYRCEITNLEHASLGYRAGYWNVFILGSSLRCGTRECNGDLAGTHSMEINQSIDCYTERDWWRRATNGAVELWHLSAAGMRGTKVHDVFCDTPGKTGLAFVGDQATEALGCYVKDPGNAGFAATGSNVATAADYPSWGGRLEDFRVVGAGRVVAEYDGVEFSGTAREWAYRRIDIYRGARAGLRVDHGSNVGDQVLTEETVSQGIRMNATGAKLSRGRALNGQFGKAVGTGENIRADATNVKLIDCESRDTRTPPVVRTGFTLDAVANGAELIRPCVRAGEFDFAALGVEPGTDYTVLGGDGITDELP